MTTIDQPIDQLIELAPERTDIRSVTTPVPVGTWNSVLAADPGATALQTPAYLAAVLEPGAAATSVASTRWATAVSWCCR